MMQSNRRDFLKAAGTATAVGGASALSLFSTAANAEAATGEYKAIVCVLLAGGCDSFNLLMPAGGGAANKAYAHARTNLALDPAQGLAIQDGRTGENFVLHPAMGKLKALYDEKDAALIANIGPLVQPTTKEQYLASAVPLPKGLLSHKDQIRHWQTSVPQDRGAKGWAGAVNDETRAGEKISRNISLSGSNLFQYGQQTSEYAITNKGSVGLDIYDKTGAEYRFIRPGVESVLRQTGGDMMKQYYSDRIFEAHQGHGFFRKALRQGAAVKQSFPNSDFGRDMKMVARTIAAREAVGAPMQIFFVEYDGWDHHDGVLVKQNQMLGDLADGLFAFTRAMQQLGADKQVTSFTISDFGRTLTSNGNGSDHGWGGNMMVIGGDVKGGQVLGDFPDLTLGNPLDIGSGIFVPTLPTDALYASLGGWLGLAKGDIDKTLPNLGSFAAQQQALDLFGAA